MSFPEDLKYTKEHEWLLLSGSEAKIGVTTYAIEQLGDIVHIDLPEVGKSFAQGASFGTIESTKTVSDLYLPVAGKILEVNKAALAKPESLQADAYKAGWLVKIQVTNPSEVSKLFSAADYEKFVKEDAH